MPNETLASNAGDAAVIPPHQTSRHRLDTVGLTVYTISPTGMIDSDTTKSTLALQAPRLTTSTTCQKRLHGREVGQRVNRRLTREALHERGQLPSRPGHALAQGRLGPLRG